MYRASPRSESIPVRDCSLSDLAKTITMVSRQARRPETFAHVEPHALATARLARHFASCILRRRHGSMTLNEIEFAAHMHDIGKYFITSSILLKPGQLDEEERAIMSLHAAYGATIIAKLPGTTEAIRSVVLHHHERWDGNGYPEGLAGPKIPLVARIVSVVDVYTSLRSKRSYKKAFSRPHAISTLASMAGDTLDPCLVEDFVKLLPNKHWSDSEHSDLNCN